MHPLLERQLRRHLGTADAAPQELRALIAAVDDAYTAADDDRALLERALEVSSQDVLAANDEVRLTLRHLQTILASAPDGIYGMDMGGKVTFANAATEELLGWPPGELLGQAIHSLAHHTRADGTPLPREECLTYRAFHTGKRQFSAADTFWRRDGTSFPAEATSMPMRDERGTIVGAVVTFRNISDRLRMERQLVHAMKMESIGHLAAGVAHELNTPIQYVGDNLRFIEESLAACYSVLHAYRESPAFAGAERARLDAVEAAADVAYLEEEIPRAVSQSLEGLTRAARIVHAMKEFSHPGGAEKELVDVNRAVETTTTVARNEWKYVANVELELEPDLPLLRCFPDELNQVFLNILVNGAHAIGEAGRRPEEGRILIRTRLDEGRVEIAFTDNGAGVPAEHQHKLFDPFFTTKDVGKGTGQGLAIAHAFIVEKLGGSIEFETELGRGTTFFVRVPVT